jgi:hypothetical protein
VTNRQARRVLGARPIVWINLKQDIGIPALARRSSSLVVCNRARCRCPKPQTAASVSSRATCSGCPDRTWQQPPPGRAAGYNLLILKRPPAVTNDKRRAQMAWPVIYCGPAVPRAGTFANRRFTLLLRWGEGDRTCSTAARRACGGLPATNGTIGAARPAVTPVSSAGMLK